MFHTRLHQVDVAADRADALAAMTGAGIDETTLALRVATGGFLPPSLADRPLWSGISASAPDHCLVWERDRVREVRRWQPPAPELSLAEDAEAVREALVAALDERAPGRGRLSSDLSGGMDSTSLVTFRWVRPRPRPATTTPPSPPTPSASWTAPSTSSYLPVNSRGCSGCLQRTIATALLCRVRGAWPTWCTGVRTHPFAAHAWVEAEGRLVGEGHLRGHFKTLMSIAPVSHDRER
ncbi:lasso peptide biosynthesis B2 protein [Streptomyces sp. NPDC046915]|uniref:lasso peptide biosynthesis B2 protein n=1 Tax=Streptomyces sp. NPDC046915 TaxID=3155257 RepID=UPI0033DFC2CF